MGNVNKLVISPPGYAGPPRKGHLVFDACFESGEYSSPVIFHSCNTSLIHIELVLAATAVTRFAKMQTYTPRLI